MRHRESKFALGVASGRWNNRTMQFSLLRFHFTGKETDLIAMARTKQEIFWTAYFLVSLLERISRGGREISNGRGEGTSWLNNY